MTIAEKFKGTEPAYPEPPGLQPHERCSRHSGVYWERPERNGGGYVCSECHPFAVNDAEVTVWTALLRAGLEVTN